MIDVQYDLLTPPRGVPLTRYLEQHALKLGAMSCVFHYVVTADSVVPMRPLVKRTVRDSRRYSGVYVACVGVTKEFAAEKLQGLLTQQ